ncbi:fasciclin domain-containing protein [Cellulomonas sp. ATA003]|uniref:fasciclin domain-containing protein n=1 Tax=Cellulomonas sp. ATA003 TaxID=3073064 RepID=UPI002872EFA5|nr:fasciclin domain-containing protein [Cellulomonas sp. ATA003]WNB85376.1 fasciclin domain-containing protein [Cellulomonas sp. ATA003]
MSHRRLVTSLAAAAVAVGTVAAPAAAAPTAASAAAGPGTTSLASVLLADGDTFDHRWSDYDVVTQVVLAVLAAKPDSPVGLLTDGTVPLTAFLPDDRAFRILARDVTGSWERTESAVFDDVASLGIDTVEAVLLYHVVPGATIDSRTALASDGAALTTASGGTVTVDVLSRRGGVARLVDADRNDFNPFLDRRALDVNAGNAQIAHGITAVLRPADL